MPGTKNSGGRNRKSGALHVIQGTFQPSRHAASSDVEAPRGTPAARDLTGEALAEWDRMIVRLDSIGTLSTVDDAALRRYVLLHAQTEGLQDEYARLRQLSAKLTKTSRTLAGSELVAAVAEIVALEKLQARLLPQLRQGSMALRQWLVEFGLTPAARTRVKPSSGASPAATSDPKKARYFNGA